MKSLISKETLGKGLLRARLEISFKSGVAPCTVQCSPRTNGLEQLRDVGGILSPMLLSQRQLWSRSGPDEEEQKPKGYILGVQVEHQKMLGFLPM